MDGSKVHDALREDYALGKGLVQGDVLGMLIHVGDPDSKGPEGASIRKEQKEKLARKGSSEIIGADENGAVSTHIKDSFVQFFRNGNDLGVAFRSLTMPDELIDPALGSSMEDVPASEVANGPATTKGYCAMASLYQDATVRFIPGPNFKFAPSVNTKYKPLSELASVL